MIQVLSVVDRKVAYMEKLRKFYKKNRRICRDEQTNSLNTNKTELIFFSRNNSDFGSIFNKNEVFTTSGSCRYFGIQIERNLIFDEQLNKTLKKMAHAMRSIYLIRHQVPLNARILLLKSFAISLIIFGNFSFIIFGERSANPDKDPTS